MAQALEGSGREELMISIRVPKKHIELNLKAFDEGRALGQSAGQA